MHVCMSTTLWKGISVSIPLESIGIAVFCCVGGRCFFFGWGVDVVFYLSR
jgi:hypothetical protein